MKGFNRYTVIFFINVYLCCCYGDLVASVLPTATVIPECQHNGKTYAPFQSFNPSPCEHCMCSSNGRVACAIADCFFTPCVDAVHDPKRCCPICPHGNEEFYLPLYQAYLPFKKKNMQKKKKKGFWKHCMKRRKLWLTA